MNPDFVQNCYEYVLKRANKKFEYNGKVSFSLTDLMFIMEYVLKENLVNEFYADVYCYSEEGVMEAYWDQLSIQIKNDSRDNIEDFILRSTRKKH